jgi:hypothetical protein
LDCALARADLLTIGTLELERFVFTAHYQHSAAYQTRHATRHARSLAAARTAVDDAEFAAGQLGLNRGARTVANLPEQPDLGNALFAANGC